jgi:hypothetical protein
VTLSGENYRTLNTVLKRVAPDGSVAVVPRTSTTIHIGNDAKLAPAGPFLAKHLLYVVNTTADELGLEPHFGSPTVGDFVPVEINYTLPNFKILVPGKEDLGHLTVDIDYSQSSANEVSPASEPQRSRIRIGTDSVNRLDAVSERLYGGSTGTEFERPDGRKFRITAPPPPTEVFICQVRPPVKLPLDGVRLGDGALARDGKSIFLALAQPGDAAKVRVLKVDVQSRETKELAVNTRGNVFAVPNAIAVADRSYYAMFADTSFHQAGLNFESPSTVGLQRIREILALAASPGGSMYYVARTDFTPTPLYWLRVFHQPENTTTEVKLDQISTPVGFLPLAVSPDGKTVVIGDKAGMLFIDVPSRRVEAFRNYELRDPVDVVFSPDGRWVFAAHAECSLGPNPRRVVFASDLTVTRVTVGRINESQRVRLPNVSGDFGLTAMTNQTIPQGGTSKEQVALSLAVAPDVRSLFVSCGKTIRKYGTDPMALQPWSAEVEQPCRLIGAARGMVYALGSTYVGDGTRADEYKTQLYFVPAPSA